MALDGNVRNIVFMVLYDFPDHNIEFVRKGSQLRHE